MNIYWCFHFEGVYQTHDFDKMLYLWMNFQKLFDEYAQTDFFRVWTSFMFFDKDLTFDWNIHLEKKQFLCQICNTAWNLTDIYKDIYRINIDVFTLRVFIRHMILKIHFGKKQFLCQICNSASRMNIDVFTFLVLIRQILNTYVIREETVMYLKIECIKLHLKFILLSLVDNFHKNILDVAKMSLWLQKGISY